MLLFVVAHKVRCFSVLTLFCDVIVCCFITMSDGLMFDQILYVIVCCYSQSVII